MVSKDPLKFKDKISYTERVKKIQSKTKLKDAVRTAYGMLKGEMVVIASMDFNFIGGSMGSLSVKKLLEQ